MVYVKRLKTLQPNATTKGREPSVKQPPLVDIWDNWGDLNSDRLLEIGWKVTPKSVRILEPVKCSLTRSSDPAGGFGILRWEIILVQSDHKDPMTGRQEGPREGR